MLYYSGRVHTIIFENPADAFYILVMVLDEKFESDPLAQRTIKVRGNIVGLKIKVGMWFGFEGKWINDPKYGRQIKLIKAPTIKGGWNADVAVSMLTGHGVTPIVAERLAEHFGDDLISALNSGDPTQLEVVPAITPFAAAHVSERWVVVRAYFQALDFLGDAGLPPSKVQQVWKHFGGEAEQVLSLNPWQLVQVDGVTFQQADEVARRLGKDLSDPKRVEGALLHITQTGKGMGHLYQGTGELLAATQSLISELDLKKMVQALVVLHQGGQVVIDRKTRPGVTAVYEPWVHHLETTSADLMRDRWRGACLEGDSLTEYLQRLAWSGPRAEESLEGKQGLREVARAALLDWSAGSKLELSEHQLLGALNALIEPISILTGLPGTGKSTTLRAVVKVLQDADIGFLLLAPTGIAAKRMNSLTGAPAHTIHRAFGAKGWNKEGGDREATYVGVKGSSDSVGSDGSGEMWEAEDHPAQVVIIDESSMMDQHLLYRVLTCTNPKARIVFVGDAAQLPSVGPGNVLRDLLATELFPTVSLTQIFRQEDTSDIVVAAHDIHAGRVPDVSNAGDFTFLAKRDEDDILALVLTLAERLYKRRRNFQVLSPRHKGTLGVTNLNDRLRSLLNPKSPGLQEMRLGSEVIREGDRVMVVKNNYELKVFNGDVGKVSRLDRKARKVVIKLHGPPVIEVSFDFSEAPRYLRLAYCQTIHKMQGQESDIILMPLIEGFRHQLQRNVIYTAITRARKNVFLVGHPQALAMAVHNNRPDARNTLFPERLLLSFAAGEVDQDVASSA